VVIRGDLGELPAFHLLGDSAAAGYMWDCLLDAMAEFGGRPVGLAALQRACGTIVSNHSDGTRRGQRGVAARYDIRGP
jgi:hypothetical protein